MSLFMSLAALNAEEYKKIVIILFILSRLIIELLRHFVLFIKDSKSVSVFSKNNSSPFDKKIML